ncbi:hypothetical protein KFL_000150480 [Klebsormidium nitens]|uniref:Uncharacterized protein n=1 Tax=Klebsormidium nitens TaxID=105231 RepID=A0A1Y1HJA3_KLENI|nr:hypothetical protein KFL_000150480 [Klebsormidium nitens]|eukprot:GAQ78594.1 hypothetical protein KFL_000150480 [Klebsormidium nitens]
MTQEGSPQHGIPLAVPESMLPTALAANHELTLETLWNIWCVKRLAAFLPPVFKALQLGVRTRGQVPDWWPHQLSDEVYRQRTHGWAKEDVIKVLKALWAATESDPGLAEQIVRCWARYRCQVISKEQNAMDAAIGFLNQQPPTLAQESPNTVAAPKGTTLQRHGRDDLKRKEQDRSASPVRDKRSRAESSEPEQVRARHKPAQIDLFDTSPVAGLPPRRQLWGGNQVSGSGSADLPEQDGTLLSRLQDLCAKTKTPVAKAQTSNKAMDSLDGLFTPAAAADVTAGLPGYTSEPPRARARLTSSAAEREEAVLCLLRTLDDVANLEAEAARHQILGVIEDLHRLLAKAVLYRDLRYPCAILLARFAHREDWLDLLVDRIPGDKLRGLVKDLLTAAVVQLGETDMNPVEIQKPQEGSSLAPLIRVLGALRKRAAPFDGAWPKCSEVLKKVQKLVGKEGDKLLVKQDWAIAAREALVEEFPWNFATEGQLGKTSTLSGEDGGLISAVELALQGGGGQSMEVDLQKQSEDAEVFAADAFNWEAEDSSFAPEEVEADWQLAHKRAESDASLKENELLSAKRRLSFALADYHQRYTEYVTAVNWVKKKNGQLLEQRPDGEERV